MRFQYLSDSSSIIAVTGLGGHAFGSFKERGGGHMWLRDKIPEHFPGARVMTYGYDSQLLGTSSFQGLKDISLTFKNHLRGVRGQPVSLARSVLRRLVIAYLVQSRKSKVIPIFFIGHSMGGLVIKKVVLSRLEGISRYAHDQARPLR